MMHWTIRGVVPVFALLVSSMATAAGPDIPTSPSAILETGTSTTATDGGDSAGTTQGAGKRTSDRKASLDRDTEVKPLTLRVKPGVTEVLPIAKNHLNRIVTPYTTPNVRTTSNAKVEVKGHVVYVASRSEAPITLYIMPAGSEAQALSLALVPRAVPPKEVNLELADARGEGRARRLDPGAARAWESSQAYVKTIEQLLSGLARGQVPSGYGLDDITAAMWQPACTRPEGADLRYDFAGIGQRVSGGSLIAYVGRVTNVDDEVLELDERWCRTAGVVASAFWPRIVLEPGQQSEVFVVRRRRAESGAPERPSLLED